MKRGENLRDEPARAMQRPMRDRLILNIFAGKFSSRFAAFVASKLHWPGGPQWIQGRQIYL